MVKGVSAEPLTLSTDANHLPLAGRRNEQDSSIVRLSGVQAMRASSGSGSSPT